MLSDTYTGEKWYLEIIFENLKILSRRNYEENPAKRDLNKEPLEFSHCLGKGK